MASQLNISGATSGNYIKLDNQILDVWAQEILFTAAPVLKFLSIARKQTELMKLPGQKIKFLRYAPLTGKSDIAETATVETTTMSTSTTDITVSEHVKAVAVNELLLKTSQDATLDRAATLLGMHYAEDVDRMVRDALLTTSNVVWAGGNASRASLDAADYMDTNCIRDAVEMLATKKAPKFGGDAYLCFVHPHQGRRLRQDPNWLTWSSYSAPEQIFNGEIGRIEDVRFIETTFCTMIKKTTQDIWADSVDTGDNTSIAANAATDVYQSIVIGDWAVGFAEALPVEMRDNGVVDFGREHDLAYYHISGAGLIEANHSLVIESA